MKFAMIGSYGHAGYALDAAAQLTAAPVVAVARWGQDDPLPYVGTHPATPDSLPVYDDYREMLDTVRPEVVGVFVPLYRIAEVATAAVEAGCHVLAEKPLATEPDDLNRLASAVEVAGVEVVALLTARGEACFQAARQAVADGAIGRVCLACGQKSYPFASRDDYYKTRETYGGSIGWQAIHALDFVSWCAGTDYTRTSAMQSNAAHPTHPGMEDEGAILLELAGGGHAVISFDYLRPWPGGGTRPWGDDRLRLVGTEGIIEVLDGRATLMTNDAETALPLPEPINVAEAFLEQIDGRGEGLITTAESLRITDVALRCRQAADEGTVIDLGGRCA
jgi:predicted dehydrogenase